MQTLAVTPIYAGLLAFLYLFLTFSVIRLRRQKALSLGDGGDAAFLRRMRGHGNFAEYVPMALILMALAELGGASGLLLNGIGALLLAGRLVHGWCFLFTDRNLSARVAGMVMTLIAIGSAGAACLGVGFLA